MTRRILSTLILWTVVFTVVWYFRTAGAVTLIVALSVLTLRELYRLLGAAGSEPFSRFGMFFGALITAAPWVEARFGSDAHHFPAHPLLPFAAVILCVRILSEREPEKRLAALSSTVFGLVYVAMLLQYLVRLVTPSAASPVGSDARLLLCVWLIMVAKLCDTGALLTGLLCGRHPMAPRISPKKTWEGAAGGILVSMGVGAGFARLAQAHLPAFFTPLHAALLAAPIAAVAIVSDLIESIIKRQAEFKDSGSAIPGIGGIFDVTDSLLLVAPVGYFLLGFR